MTTTPEPTVSACPFCHCAGAELSQETGHESHRFYWMTCPTCGAHGPVSSSKAVAVLRWNISLNGERRPTKSEVPL